MAPHLPALLAPVRLTAYISPKVNPMAFNVLSRRSVLAAAAFAALPLQAFAQRRLTPEDAADVERVEQYLNSLKTFRARFLQVDPAGGTAEGTLYLSRPGKLRIDYDAPNPNLLIANGQHLIHFDRALKAPAYLGLDSTPAGLLVRDPVKLSGDVTVAGVERGPGVLRVALIQSKDPRAGRITLVFSERPFQLTNWQVTDAQGQLTRIALYEPQTGMALDPKLFVFLDPNVFGEQGTR
jgi:outer membrane lipoprotein-sorting protein